MRNPFKKREVFEFSKGELVVFKEFLRDLVPLSTERWPGKNNRPKFEGMPEYSLSVVITEDSDSDALILISARFKSYFRTASSGGGNMIILKIAASIEQVFIHYEAELQKGE